MNSQRDRRGQRGQRGLHPNSRQQGDCSVVACAVADTGDIRVVEAVLDLDCVVEAQPESKFQSWQLWSFRRALEMAYAVQGESASESIEVQAQNIAALSTAAYKVNVVAVKKLLSARANAAIKNHYQRSALHVAAAEGHELIVQT